MEGAQRGLVPGHRPRGPSQGPAGLWGARRVVGGAGARAAVTSPTDRSGQGLRGACGCPRVQGGLDLGNGAEKGQKGTLRGRLPATSARTRAFRGPASACHQLAPQSPHREPVVAAPAPASAGPALDAPRAEPRVRPRADAGGCPPAACPRARPRTEGSHAAAAGPGSVALCWEKREAQPRGPHGRVVLPAISPPQKRGKTPLGRGKRGSVDWPWCIRGERDRLTFASLRDGDVCPAAPAC